METSVYRCIVACHSCNGPDLFFVKVRATQEQYNNGKHYDAAKGAASDDGYDVEKSVEFDEYDTAGRAMCELFVWGSASTVDAKD